MSKFPPHSQSVYYSNFIFSSRAFLKPFQSLYIYIFLQHFGSFDLEWQQKYEEHGKISNIRLTHSSLTDQTNNFSSMIRLHSFSFLFSSTNIGVTSITGPLLSPTYGAFKDQGRFRTKTSDTTAQSSPRLNALYCSGSFDNSSFSRRTLGTQCLASLSLVFFWLLRFQFLLQFLLQFDGL